MKRMLTIQGAPHVCHTLYMTLDQPSVVMSTKLTSVARPILLNCDWLKSGAEPNSHESCACASATLPLPSPSVMGTSMAGHASPHERRQSARLG